MSVRNDNRPKAHPDCDVCNNRHAYRDAIRQRWVAEGLCPLCGRTRDRFRRCQHCRRVDNARKQRQRDHQKKVAA